MLSAQTAGSPWQPGEGWRLVWADEFDGSSVDPAHWTFDLGPWGTNELQTYTRSAVTVQSGELRITARREANGTYTSGRIKTQGLHAWKYGKIAARLRLPQGRGIWPAFWMLGQDISAVGWPLTPAGGEPKPSFDAVDALLLDGRRLGALRERARRSRVRWATAAFCSVALLIELFMLARLTRASDRRLDQHLEREGVAGDEALRLAPRRSPTLLIALAAVALGFLVMALAAIVRLR